jgi:VanZ family protein
MDSTATRRATLRSPHLPRVLLAVYVLSLTLIAVWPVPVDRGAEQALGLMTRLIPWLTYPRIEFGANILLFVPMGVLSALMLTQRYLVVPIAVITTVAIESLQATVLAQRTPSVLDIVANVTGACVGLLLVAAVEAARTRSQRRDYGRPMP